MFLKSPGKKVALCKNNRIHINQHVNRTKYMQTTSMYLECCTFLHQFLILIFSLHQLALQMAGEGLFQTEGGFVYRRACQRFLIPVRSTPLLFLHRFTRHGGHLTMLLQYCFQLTYLSFEMFVLFHQFITTLVVTTRVCLS